VGEVDFGEERGERREGGADVAGVEGVFYLPGVFLAIKGRGKREDNEGKRK
jgi:hypothetical protein